MEGKTYWKILLLMKRKPGISMEEFRDHYENNHIPLCRPYMSGIARYFRRYLEPQPHAVLLVAVLELPHVQLARRGGRLGAVSLTVNHQTTHTANPFAAVVVEGDRLLAIVEQTLVHDVQHLEERHVRRDALGFVFLEPAVVLRATLPPYVQHEIHIVRH